MRGKTQLCFSCTEEAGWHLRASSQLQVSSEVHGNVLGSLLQQAECILESPCRESPAGHEPQGAHQGAQSPVLIDHGQNKWKDKHIEHILIKWLKMRNRRKTSVKNNHIMHLETHSTQSPCQSCESWNFVDRDIYKAPGDGKKAVNPDLFSSGTTFKTEDKMVSLRPLQSEMLHFQHKKHNRKVLRRWKWTRQKGLDAPTPWGECDPYASKSVLTKSSEAKERGFGPLWKSWEW